ncbi:MAG: hypothetical protein M3471_08465, partial [Actinomycetota bacterium]|nr:hypothetical protein [Actinomycetota bacterium]
LLDEWLPVVAGSEINDDPFAPVSRYARDLVDDLFSAAVLTVFRRCVEPATVRELVAAFDEGRVMHTGDDVASSAYVELVAEVPALRDAVRCLIGDEESSGAVAFAVEFLLEGLHLSKRLNKESAADGRAVYLSRR